MRRLLPMNGRQQSEEQYDGLLGLLGFASSQHRRTPEPVLQKVLPSGSHPLGPLDFISPNTAQ